MEILKTTKEGKSEVLSIETTDEKKKKPRFLPLNEDKYMFILWVLFIYLSGLLLSYNILISLFLFFAFGTALLNNVGHLMKDKEKEE